MKFCSECGTSLGWREFEGKRRAYCPHCGKIFFGQLKVGAGCLIEQNDKILLVLRAKEPFRDRWNLPAGYVEDDEKPIEAAERETFEETGLRVKGEKLIGVYPFTDDPRGNGILIVYRCRMVSGEIKTTDEGLRAEFFGKRAIPEKLAGGGHNQAIWEWAES